MPSEEDIVRVKIGEVRGQLIYELARDAWGEKQWRDTQEDAYKFCERMISVYLGGYQEHELKYLRLLMQRFRTEDCESTLWF